MQASAARQPNPSRTVSRSSMAPTIIICIRTWATTSTWSPLMVCPRSIWPAVILDTTDRYRQAKAHHPDPAYRDPNGLRYLGFIPVLQLNYLFNRDVPCAVGPFQAMRSPEDRMLDLPRFQQLGVELLLRTLRESTVPVDLLSFGSARALAVAFNRDPELLRKKVRRIHLSAGTS